MSSSYDWLCCYCSDAVISRSVSEQCFNCGHILCSKCAVEDPKYSLASVTNKLQTTLTSNGLETIRSMSSCMHVYDQPLTRIDVQEIDPASQQHACSAHPTTNIENFNSGIRSYGNDTEYRWTCCNCHFSQNNLANDAACARCQHWMDKYCSITEVIYK